MVLPFHRRLRVHVNVDTISGFWEKSIPVKVNGAIVLGENYGEADIPKSKRAFYRAMVANTSL